MLVGGGIPVVARAAVKLVPHVLANPGTYTALAAPVAGYLRSQNTNEEMMDMGYADGVGSGLSAARLIDAASMTQGRGSWAARRLNDAWGVAVDAKKFAHGIAIPSRRTVLPAALAPIKTTGRIGAAAVDTLLTTTKGLGKGLAADAAGTLIAGAVLESAAHLGALNQFGTTTEQAKKHVRDFTTTEVMGVTVPNVDPVLAVAKTGDAFVRLSDKMQEEGNHGASAYEHGKFVSDEISEELGGGIPATVAGAAAGVLVGSVVGVKHGVGATYDAANTRAEEWFAKGTKDWF